MPKEAMTSADVAADEDPAAALLVGVEYPVIFAGNTLEIVVMAATPIHEN